MSQQRTAITSTCCGWNQTGVETVPILSVHHVTTYRYRQPVAFGEHRMMFRPREGHDQKLLEMRLEISPEPDDLRWLHDVFGNSVCVARFSERAGELKFDSTVLLDHTSTNALDFQIEPNAATYPFSYDAEDMPDLARSIERQYPDPDHKVEQWARRFSQPGGPTSTWDMLAELAYAVRREFVYIPRQERGVQQPLRTLELGSGTCRDFAVLMIEAVRSLGLAAHCVSGYIYTPEPIGQAGGGATHAWLRVYIPGAGWVELDPTNGIVGNRDLIRVAIARDHRYLRPLHGTWTGFPSDSLGMSVTVSVTEQEKKQ